jgi:hypothetical protein
MARLYSDEQFPREISEILRTMKAYSLDLRQ